RLVRIEDRGGQRLELTHDLLTGVVRASRDRRRARETAEKETLARREAEDRAQKALGQLRRSRLVMLALLAFALVALGAAIWAFREQQKAIEAEQHSNAAQKEALSQRELALQREVAAKNAAHEADEAKKEAMGSAEAAKRDRAGAVKARADALEKAS